MSVIRCIVASSRSGDPIQNLVMNSQQRSVSSLQSKKSGKKSATKAEKKVKEVLNLRPREKALV